MLQFCATIIITVNVIIIIVTVLYCIGQKFGEFHHIASA